MTRDEVVAYLTSHGFVPYIQTDYWVHLDGPECRASVSPTELCILSANRSGNSRCQIDRLALIDGQLYIKFTLPNTD